MQLNFNMLNKVQQKVLQDLQDYYKYCSNSAIRKEWLADYKKNTEYYYGNQWSNEELAKELEDVGCKPKTFNHIKPSCNDVLSVITRTSKRIGFLPTTELSLHKKLSEYLKHWAFNVQTQTSHKYFSTLKMLSALLGGIGWSYFGYDEGKFIYENVDSREMYSDPDDHSPRQDRSNVICRSYFVNNIILKNKYPKHANKFDDIADGNKNKSDLLYNTEDFYDLDSNVWVKGKSIRIVEVYYKKTDTYYETTVKSENSNSTEIVEEYVLKTFHRDYAERVTNTGEILERKGTRIYKGVFTDQILLSHGPINEQVPNQKYFPLLPMVFQRDLKGKPVGAINGIIETQDMINYVLSTLIHKMDTKTLIVHEPGNDKDSIIRNWETELRKKTGVVLIPKAKDIEILDNNSNIQHMVLLLQELKNQIQSNMRIYDDFAGKQTNRISGVAINASMQNNLNSQIPLLLFYEYMLVSEGKLMLDTLKGVKDLKQTFIYYKDGQNTSAVLDDKIAMVNFEVYPQSSANYNSNIEEEKAIFLDIMSSQVKDLFLMSPLFMQEAGISDSNSHRLSDEYRRIMQEMMGLQQGQNEQLPEEVSGQENMNQME